MSNISELRAKIASGEIKPTAGGGNYTPKVGAGIFNCLVTDSQFGRGNGGNPRVMMTCRVISGGTENEVGGEFRYYIATTNERYLQESIALWCGLLTETYGIPEDKIYYDAEDERDIAANIASISAKLAANGRLVLVIKRSPQKGKDSNGHQQYYNDIQSAVDGAAQVSGTQNLGTPAAVVITEGPVSKGQIAAVAGASKPWK